MYKKALVLSVILVFAGASLALAGPPTTFTPWKCLVYDGMVWNGPGGGVIEDTGVFVTNPNPSPVWNWMRIFDKYGNEVWSGHLWNTSQQIQQIPSMGFGWMPLGWALSNVEPPYITNGREKFSYMIYIVRPRD